MLTQGVSNGRRSTTCVVIAPSICDIIVNIFFVDILLLPTEIFQPAMAKLPPAIGPAFQRGWACSRPQACVVDDQAGWRRIACLESLQNRSYMCISTSSATVPDSCSAIYSADHLARDASLLSPAQIRRVCQLSYEHTAAVAAAGHRGVYRCLHRRHVLERAAGFFLDAFKFAVYAAATTAAAVAGLALDRLYSAIALYLKRDRAQVSHAQVLAGVGWWSPWMDAFFGSFDSEIACHIVAVPTASYFCLNGCSVRLPQTNGLRALAATWYMCNNTT